MTLSPLDFLTGEDSPVSSDSSTWDSPFITVPSEGTLSPDLTSTRSPGFRDSMGTSMTFPSLRRWASAGRSLASPAMASEAPLTDFISIQCPRSITSIRVTSSMKKTIPSTPAATARL